MRRSHAASLCSPWPRITAASASRRAWDLASRLSSIAVARRGIVSRRHGRVAARFRTCGIVMLLDAQTVRPASGRVPRPKGSVMTRTRQAIAALIALGLAAAPFAASAQQTSGMGAQGSTIGSSGAPAQQGTTFGSSGQTVGTVTAPSIGTFSQPSVGVTNSVPTWNNTNPPIR